MQDFNHILRCQRPEAKTVNVFRDPSPVHKRPISNISWCPDGGSRIAISYCNLEFQASYCLKFLMGEYRGITDVILVPSKNPKEFEHFY